MKEIKQMFQWQGMLIISILMLVSILMIYFIPMLPIFIIGGFFIGVGIYCWYGYIGNILIKPKNEVLYLTDKEGKKHWGLSNKNKYNYWFINNKGKSFFINTNEVYELNNFYLVLKTKDYIVKVIEKSDNQFKFSQIKESYWLNCYLPAGNFENIFLLPIIYFIGLIGLVLGLGMGRIDFSAIIMAIDAIYFIIYDLIYKIKKRKSIDGDVVNSNLVKFFSIFINITKLVTIFIICIFLFILFISIKVVAGKLLLLPFLLCTICLFWQTISSIIKNAKLVELFGKMYILIFLVYWFGITGIGLYSSIVNKEYGMLLVVIPFIVVGIWVGYKSFVKKK